MAKLSLVVPCYNEGENVLPFHEAAVNALGKMDLEIVYIDDGSRDATLHNLKKIYAKKDCKVKIVSFSRNFGKESGIYAGLEHATGDYICIIDADLQQRPEIVKDMVAILEEKPEVDVVAAFQDRRSEGKVLSFFKRSFYKVINRLSKVPLQPDASDFRTFRRSVRDSILELAEYHRFSKGIFAWVGYSTKFIPYTACERATGTTKWSFWKLFLYALEGIVAFSTMPLVLSSVFGILCCALALIMIIVVIIRTLVFGDPTSGWPSLVCIMLLLSGIQMLGIGVVGQYLAKTYLETKHRPIYLTRLTNIEKKAKKEEA